MVKVLPEDFKKFLKNNSGKKFAVACHSKPDVDAVASAFAISRLFPGSVIVTPDEMNKGATLLCEKLNIKTQLIKKITRASFDGLIVTDVSNYTLLPEAREWHVVAVFDHHQAEGRDMKADNYFVDSGSPSTAELIATLLENKFDSDVAFALCCAIIADGARFKSARVNTFATLARLMEIAGGSYSEMLGYAEPEFDSDVKIAVLKAMQRVKFVYSAGYVVATSEVGMSESDSASLISEAADVAFVANWKDAEKETRISARARKNVIVPLHEVMAAVAKEVGGAGGGHAKAAGASLKCHSDVALAKCVEVFVRKAEGI